MEFQTYLNYFKEIMDSKNPEPPYDNPDYINYTKLNWSRMNRWLKHGELIDELKKTIAAITKRQHWIVITEPWCGDAAHLVPFFEMAAALNPLISISFELRDTPPFRINQYLTNGKSKSIPILVVQDKDEKDIFHWGPRPKEAQQLYMDLHDRKVGFEETKIVLQEWYNKDKGVKLQQELAALLKDAVLRVRK